MSEQTPAADTNASPAIERLFFKNQAQICLAPHPISLSATTPARPSVFLAGSIDMGAATDWQAELTESLSHLLVTIYNPRRPDWGGDWPQDISFPPFKEQVEWELDAQDEATVIAMFFDKKGMAPISLLELGLYAGSGKMVVCCPQGYWRRGNVQVVCKRYGITLVDTLNELTKEVIAKLGVDK